jgi:hypothetical protein
VEHGPENAAEQPEAEPPVPSRWLIAGHIVWWLAATATVIAISLTSAASQPAGDLVHGYALWGGAGCAVSAALWRLVRDRSLTWWRLGAGILGGSIAWMCLLVALWMVAAPEPATPAHAADSGSSDGMRATWILSLFVLSAWIATAAAARHSMAAREAQRRALGAQSLAREAQLQVLRNQLRPHFLFNALNTISARVSDDPRAAQRMIDDLAELLRESLSDTGMDETVSDELRRVELYLGLERARFEDDLQVDFDVDDTVRGAPMPAFLIQPLVENAVVHGMRQTAGTIDVRVRVCSSARGVDIEVSNPGSLRGSHTPGIGLANLRDRLEVIYAGAASLRLWEHGGRVRARLSMPIAAPRVA